MFIIPDLKFSEKKMLSEFLAEFWIEKSSWSKFYNFRKTLIQWQRQRWNLRIC